MDKQRILILFGGASSEHEVSVMSAASVIRAVDRTRYHLVVAGITKAGEFELLQEEEHLNSDSWTGFNEEQFCHDSSRPSLVFSPSENCIYARSGHELKNLMIDAVFPVLHGPFGEDGRLQGLLEVCGIPYVGAGVLSSAMAMDKGIAKRLFQQAGIPQAPHREVLMDHRKGDLSREITELEKVLTYPLFVKPANMGSSVGISKVSNRNELEAALGKAALFDGKVLVEKAVNAREIECAVLGSRHPIASLPAEILPSHDFYDYEDKYYSGASQTVVPADVTEKQTEQIRETALEVYRLLECQGLARVDFFLDRESGRLLVNEVNTMPGFTKISLYPKMWEASGIPYTQLIHRLIQDAFEKNREQVHTHGDAYVKEGI